MTDPRADPDAALQICGAALSRLAGDAPRLGVAVSGGSDSTGLLLAAHDWAQGRGVALSVATVDHRLRPESGAEASGVAQLCAALALRHDVLIWDHGGAPAGNLADAAREARRALLGAWAARLGLSAVLLGHTRDDQAETLLLRLARGAGVDGLSAMAEASGAGDLRLLRPALGTSRAALRALCRARDVTWVDDPSNEDLAHHRPRARAALAALAPLGLDAEGLARTADRLRGQRAALDHGAGRLAAQVLRPGPVGDLRLTLAPWAAAPGDLRQRVLAVALAQITGTRRPRQRSLAPLEAALLAPKWSARTLAGALFIPMGAEALICREPSRLPPPVPARTGAVWDERWQMHGKAPSGAVLGALGPDGLRALAGTGAALFPAWAASLREARLGAPCLRHDGALIFAPGAGYTCLLPGVTLRDLRAALHSDGNGT
ncbi:MAG: tRNA(Ile)-lysidine synthase [Paracoccaceae bacterium]|jgi:tRNA(Ile)-lysidine synthase